jgi:hypothetical protein
MGDKQTRRVTTGDMEINRIRRGGAADTYTGNEDWSVHDFLGRYHARAAAMNKSKLSLAIPGTAINVENERASREKQRAAIIKKINRDCTKKGLLRIKREAQSANALGKIKEQYGFHKQIKDIGLLLGDIDVAATKYLHEKVPNYLDPKFTGKVEECLPLEGVQRQFALDVIAGKRLEVYRCILGGYQDVDILINSYDTPLTYAVRKMDIEMIETLVVDGKANPNYPNAIGYSPLFYVYEEWRQQKREKDPSKRSLKDMLESVNDCLNILLENGGNVNARGVFGETPVHLAAGFGDAKSLFTLCRYQFDPAIQDGVGRTALDVACEHEHPECMIILEEWPKIRREVGLGFFIQEWKPFLLDPLRHINVTPALTQILEELALADRVRENKRVERLNELGTSIRYYAENDDAEDPTKAGAHLGEEGLQSIKEMKKAMMKTERKNGARELDLKLREIQKNQKYTSGRKTRKTRRRRVEKSGDSEEKPLTNTQIRRKSMVDRLIKGWIPPPPKAKKELAELERPLRSADASALFRPKRTDLFLQARAARASNLPVNLKRRLRRKQLELNMALPTHSDKDRDEQIAKDLEFKNSYDKMKPKSAMIPDEMLPPKPSATALKLSRAIEDAADGIGKKMLQAELEEESQRQQKLLPRSVYSGIRGLPKLNKTWRQSPFSLELVKWSDNMNTSGYQVI